MRAHAGSRFEVILLVMGGDRVVCLSAQRASGGERFLQALWAALAWELLTAARRGLRLA